MDNVNAILSALIGQEIDADSDSGKIRLQDWLCKEENHKFCEMLWWFVFNKERTLMWKVTQAMWKNLPSLLTEFLGTKKGKQEFGWEECPECKRINNLAIFVPQEESIVKRMCICSGSGLIKRPWLRAQEENNAEN